MRITKIKLSGWRNFGSVLMKIPEEAPLICVIGDNGTGKSNLLELISAVANECGISQGLEIARGNPLEEPHEIIEIDLLIADFAKQEIDTLLLRQYPDFKWTGRLRFSSEKQEEEGRQSKIMAQMEGKGWIKEPGNSIAQHLRNRLETHYLHIDADRSYPPINVDPNQFIEAITQDWSSPGMLKGKAHQRSKNLYEEWTRYFLGIYHNDASEYLKAAKTAKDKDNPIPDPPEQFDSYRDSVRQIFPHLSFIGVDTQKKTLIFDSAGLELRFTDLSGGEREIAFLIGQIERFKLRRGLLLLDEPELHLNPDLVRLWVTFLKNTVDEGQAWITTHSLEAVEIAGNESTIVLERNKDRVVDQASILSQKKLLSVLSKQVGSPAFSIDNLAFVYLEGDNDDGDREKNRFEGISNVQAGYRFIEGGGAKSVISKLENVRELASESSQTIRVGAIVDKDFRDSAEIKDIESKGAHVLDCHEVENLFLHPPTLVELLVRSGEEKKTATSKVKKALQEEANTHAGRWALMYASSRGTTRFVLSREAREKVASYTWEQIKKNKDEFSKSISALIDIDEQSKQLFIELLKEGVDKYESLEVSDDLWRECMGKEVLGAMPRHIGITNREFLERSILAYWEENESFLPQEVLNVRTYINGL